MSRTGIHSTFAAALAALTLTACGGATDDEAAAAGTEGNGTTTTIVTTEFAFEPVDFSLPADTPTEVVLQNDGVVEHDITVDELDLLIEAGGASTASQTVTLPAGEYVYYCSVPGHRDSGMEGTLTVQG